MRGGGRGVLIAAVAGWLLIFAVHGISPVVQTAHLRVARATDDLAALMRFYRDGLGFELLGSFEGHGDFDGVMLGHPGSGYHLEFTRRRGEEAGRAPTRENLLVFYLPEWGEWQTAVDRLKASAHTPVPSANPYWDVNGLTFEDPDGYRVVLQRAAWPSHRNEERTT